MKILGVKVACSWLSAPRLSVSWLCFLLYWLHSHSGFPFLVASLSIPVSIPLGPNPEEMRAWPSQ